MKKVFGNLKGLKSNQLRRLENLYRRRIPPEFIITPELARDLGGLSAEIKRQIGLLVNRQGKIVFVIAGDHQRIVIPDLSDYRIAAGRLRGLRCIHTHLGHEPLTTDDLTDLALLRLDLMAVMTLSPDGRPAEIHAGHILPRATQRQPYQLMPPLTPQQLNIGCLELIRALEAELIDATRTRSAGTQPEKAIGTSA